MAETPTTGDLFNAKTIVEDDLVAAVDAYIADPSLTAFLMGDGYTIDLQAAVAASPFALSMLANHEAKLASQRAVVRTAILLARPVRA